MVEIQNIKKSFGNLPVLKGIDLNIKKGNIVAVLGPNGSGKTTLIKSILGLVIPDSGEIYVNGRSAKNDFQYREHIGYLPQIARFPENLNVKELFSMIQDLRQQKISPEKLITIFGIQPFLNKPIRTLSGGTRQKINVILSLMFSPAIYIFDEPTVGLDPISRVRFKELVSEERKNGKTVLLVTHLLNEVEELADEIVFLMEGNVYYKGSPKELKTAHRENTLEKAIAKMLLANSK